MLSVQLCEVVIFSRMGHFDDTAIFEVTHISISKPNKTNLQVHQAKLGCNVIILVCRWYPSWCEQAPINILPGKLNLFPQVLKVRCGIPC